MNRNESMSPKEKFVAAKRVEAESSVGKKNEASKTVKEKSSSIQCWKCKGFGHMSKECVNKKVMVIRNGILDSDDECEDHDSQLVEEIAAYDDEYVEEGNSISLITRRVLNVQIKEEKFEDQRENLFHTRCLVKGNPCSLVIDSGSCTNVVSSFLVKRLQLSVHPHPKPYKLHWLTNKEEIKVNSQALISFTLGRYKDEVLCDVVPMHAGDILFGRPWQYDRKVTFDGLMNKYTFTLCGKKFTLLPLSPYEVHCDQLKLEKKRKEYEEQQWREETKVKVRKKSEKKKIQFLSGKNDEFDLRTNPFKERGDDMNPTTDHVHVPEGPITRSKVKKIQEAYTLHLQKLASVQVETKSFEPKNLYSISISNQEDNGVADIGK